MKGPIGLEKGVIIGRSTILGPAYIAGNTKIHDSRVRGGQGGSVYIGRNCALWDFTVIIRSLIGNNSTLHTCNIDDSIIGPDCQFGATRTLTNLESFKGSSENDDFSKLDKRIVLSNFSSGSRIKIYDPTSDQVVQTDAKHLGAIVGFGVCLSSGTVTYPGTIIGSETRINTSIPLVGYIPRKVITHSTCRQ